MTTAAESAASATWEAIRALQVDVDTLTAQLGLEVPCWACEGTGIGPYSTAWAEWFERRGDAAFDFDRDQEDPPPDEPEESACSECEGFGVILTDRGRAIMAIVWRALKYEGVLK